jgi:hypothetical protein
MHVVPVWKPKQDRVVEGLTKLARPSSDLQPTMGVHQVQMPSSLMTLLMTMNNQSTVQEVQVPAATVQA